MKLFGRNKKKQEEEKLAQEVEDEVEEEEVEEEEVEEEEVEEEEVEQPIAIEYYARYIGGHPLYPKERDVFVVFWNHQLEVRHHFDKPAQIVIPYSDMTNVENMSEEQLKAARVVALGILGALWKKKYRYTVIQYKDELGSERAIVMDFHGHIERVQQLIYRKMLESKKGTSYLSMETSNEMQKKNMASPDDTLLFENETIENTEIPPTAFEPSTSNVIQDRNNKSSQTNENNVVRVGASSVANNQSQQVNKQSNDELKHALKMRLVKGDQQGRIS